MLPSKNSFLDHVKWLRKAVAAEEAEFILAGDTMQALVRKGNMHLRLRPQFLITIDGTRQYSSTPSDGPQMFAGWFPYETRRWRLASDKLAFKHFAQSAGFQVPEHDVSPTSQMTDVVVKRTASSFGTQVSGPYRTAQEHTIDPSLGEYYERFIFGDLVKIWFWNAEPICAEVDRMPYVMGDGVLNLRQQIIVRARYARTFDGQPLLVQLTVMLSGSLTLLLMAFAIAPDKTLFAVKDGFGQIVGGAFSPLTRAQALLAAASGAISQLSFFSLLALVAVKIAVFNVLPLPSLNGGAIVALIAAKTGLAKLWRPGYTQVLQFTYIALVFSWLLAWVMYLL
ncbi:hypothetical protein [Ralstonia pickettii]|uniref:hypothetical protein n=1 Tax=Ralstonia pickettii TaxID=329 RepID=UPI000818C1D1|nr:hypothetical protein [Ralstonia pickettii]OCS45075.1 hypothetical protein BEK67_23380 [Ralstonia pickettii]